MEILSDRRAQTTGTPDLLQRIEATSDVLIDLGTGDGRFIQHCATQEPARLAIGIDTCREQLRPILGRLPANAAMIIAATEALPHELDGAATWLTINFPWGSLLHGLLTHGAVLDGLTRLTRPRARLAIRLNAGALAEAGYRLEQGAEPIRQSLRAAGFCICRSTYWGSAELRKFPSSWAKRLAFGRDPQAIELLAIRR
jgi:trans-aconitate methyltransferase